jgi:heptose-I-phosphate ethanolaminephosphotransferase
MAIKDSVKRLMCLLTEPIKRNTKFFIFMYLLGVVSSWLTLPGGDWSRLYENLYLELFVDVYFVCVLLSFIPRKVRWWVRAVIYVIIYATTISDVFCFVKFGSTITPTMLMLVGETDGREAGEFIHSYISSDLLFSKVGWILLIALVHIFTSLPIHIERHLSYRRKIFMKDRKEKIEKVLAKACPFFGIIIAAVFIWGVCASWHNKQATVKLMSGRTIGEVEHTLTEADHAELYMPINRLAFSIRSNDLAAKQITKLVKAAAGVKVDSCSFRSPNIILIIGESYNRHHSQQYGYVMPTTPRQKKLEEQGSLSKFTDVVSPWNLTSFVFKFMFSTYMVGEKGEWCDHPLFPELFRKAGYHVAFITNQFLPKAKEAVYDFSGGFFLNNPKLSAAQFDVRNTKLNKFDDGLLDDYDQLKKYNTKHNLIIFHLIGQHVSYYRRFPLNRRKFFYNDYIARKPNLNRRELGILADYDNAVLYNDSIVTSIVKLFKNDNAIVIYVPDHGEECFDGNTHFFCRLHSTAIDSRLAHAEFDVPFWIWCSKKYISANPEVYKEIRQARDRKFMTDGLSHMLLYLGGISTPEYREDCNLLSPNYNENRPRILKNTTDYNKLK